MKQNIYPSRHQQRKRSRERKRITMADGVEHAIEKEIVDRGYAICFAHNVSEAYLLAHGFTIFRTSIEVEVEEREREDSDDIATDDVTIEIKSDSELPMWFILLNHSLYNMSSIPRRVLIWDDNCTYVKIAVVFRAMTCDQMRDFFAAHQSFVALLDDADSTFECDVIDNTIEYSDSEKHFDYDHTDIEDIVDDPSRVCILLDHPW